MTQIRLSTPAFCAALAVPVAFLAVPVADAAGPPEIVVRAEPAHFGPGAEFRPALTRDQLERYASVLQLTEAQRILAIEMLHEYLQRFNDRVDELRNQMAELREEAQATHDFRDYGRRMASITQSWTAERKRLEEELLNNIKSLLNEDQVELWPLFEREKRRHDLLPNARLAGESIDLIVLVDELALEEDVRASLDDLLEPYAVQLDLALVARERALESLREEWREVMMTDREKGEKIWKEATERRAAVREVNRRTLRLLVAELTAIAGEEIAADLQRAYERRAYPEAWELTRADRLLQHLDDSDVLAEEQMEQVAVIQSSYERDLGALRTRLITEILKREEEPPPYFANVDFGEGGGTFAVRVVAAGPGGDEPEDDFSKLLRDRYELSKRTVSMIESVLTPEQQAAIPAFQPDQQIGFFGRAPRFDL